MDNTQQQDLMCKFILQEVGACKDVDPEKVTVFGPCVPDWFHPPLNQVGGVCISCCDGKDITILVCKPLPAYEPTVIKVCEEGGVFSEHKAVYFCPNAVVVMRPREEGDEALVSTHQAEELTT